MYGQKGSKGTLESKGLGTVRLEGIEGQAAYHTDIRQYAYVRLEGIEGRPPRSTVYLFKAC